jgi:hypothetical protein
MPAPPASPPDLGSQVRAHGPSAQLVSVSPEGRPHVVAVLVEVADGDAAGLVVAPGSTTRTNVATNPAVTVLWPPAPGSDHSLMVDGSATVAGDSVTIVPTSALLHRAADAAEDVPRCLAVEVPSSAADRRG